MYKYWFNLIDFYWLVVLVNDSVKYLYEYWLRSDLSSCWRIALRNWQPL